MLLEGMDIKGFLRKVKSFGNNYQLNNLSVA